MRSIAIAVALILLTAAAAAQADYSYMIEYRASGKIVIESRPGSVSGYDSDDVRLSPPGYSSSDIALTIYKENGKWGWDGDTGFYIRDGRAPLQAGQTEVFDDIFLCAGTGVVPQNLQMTRDQFVFSLSPGLTYVLRLAAIPEGVTYNGPRQWGANDLSITLPFFASADPTKGYRFQAQITAIPEPSSFLALAGALCGTGGLVLRRRRS